MQVTERPSGLAEVRGHGTIELFDERGRKEYEQPFENSIVTMGAWHQRWAQRFDLSRGMPNAAWRAGNPRPIDPFRGVLLTDSALPEGHALEGMPLGVMVGWADKIEYSGSDVYRGSPNASECAATENSVRWVFDWPTHAALGVTASVLWGPVLNYSTLARSGPAMPRLRSAGDEGANGNYYRSRAGTLICFTTPTVSTNLCGIVQLPSGSFLFTPASVGSSNFFGLGCATMPADYTGWGPSTARLGFGPSISNLGFVNGDGNFWVTCDSTDVWVTAGSKIRKFPQSSLGSADATETTVTADSAWTGMRDCSHDGTYLWICESATNKVIRINPTSGALERQWSPPNAANGETVMAIAYDPNLGRVWLGTRHNSGPGRLYLCDIDGTALAQWSMQDWYWSSNTDTTTDATTNISTVASSTAWGLCVSADGKLLSTWDNNYVLEIDPISAGTRTLLGAPVTKTSFQSMKLTYSFTFS